MTALCPWWVRWWHRRLRAADVRLLMPAILVEARGDQVKAALAWEMHLMMPGAEHWHCACAKTDVS